MSKTPFQASMSFEVMSTWIVWIYLFLKIFGFQLSIVEHISKKIVHFGIQAWNLAQILSKGHYFGKRRWPLKNSIWRPFFKMAAIAIQCLLYQLFKQWSKHNIWYKYYLKEMLMEKDACPSKMLNINYLNCSNGDASIQLGRNTLQGILFWKKVCATQNFRMATIFKMATISVK